MDTTLSASRGGELGFDSLKGKFEFASLAFELIDLHFPAGLRDMVPERDRT